MFIYKKQKRNLCNIDSIFNIVSLSKLSQLNYVLDNEYWNSKKNLYKIQRFKFIIYRIIFYTILNNIKSIYYENLWKFIQLIL